MKVLFIIAILFSFSISANAQTIDAPQEPTKEMTVKSPETSKKILSIGKQIEAARKKMGLTQEQLAAAAGISNENMKHIEDDLASPMRPIMRKMETILDLVILVDSGNNTPVALNK